MNQVIAVLGVGVDFDEVFEGLVKSGQIVGWILVLDDGVPDGTQNGGESARQNLEHGWAKMDLGVNDQTNGLSDFQKVHYHRLQFITGQDGHMDFISGGLMHPLEGLEILGFRGWSKREFAHGDS